MSSSRSNRSSSLESTINPGNKHNTTNKDVPSDKTLKELLHRVSEMQTELNALKLGAAGNGHEPPSTSRPGRRQRRSSSVDSVRSVRSVATSSSACKSPAPRAGQSDKTAIDFLQLDAVRHTSTSRRPKTPLVPGLKPVPTSLDVSRLRSAKGLQERIVKNALRGEFIELSSLYEGTELSQKSDTF